VTRTAERILEVKRRLDGSTARFDCELVARSPHLVIACYRFRDALGPVDSYGWFWRRRPYLCYYMLRSGEDRPFALRFDVVRDVELAPAEIRYTDLLLDLWVRDGVAAWEDEDEVSAATAAGLLPAADLARIERARRTLQHGHRRIAVALRRQLAALGRFPPAASPARPLGNSSRTARATPG
jgi:hypothetical protein